VSLGYQIVWYRSFVDRFGSTNLTFILVLCSFIGGLGAGALASRRFTDGVARRTGLQDPLRVYGVVEMLLAAAVVPTALLRYFPVDVWGSFPYRLGADGVYHPAAVVQLSQVGIATAVVLVPCFLMGVTFPLLCHAFRGERRLPAGLYAWNTLGACSGVLVSEFLFLPLVGHARTLWVLLGLNAGIGLYFLAPGRRGPASAPPASPGQPGAGGPPPPDPAPGPRRRGNYAPPSAAPAALLWFGILSGLLTGVLEGDAFKRLEFLGCTSNGTAMSFISFWAILAIFLASWTVRAFPGLPLGFIKIAWVFAWAYHLTLWLSALPIRSWLGAKEFQRLFDAAVLAHPGETLEVGQYFYFQGGLGWLLLFSGLFVFPTIYLASLLLPHVMNRGQDAGRHLGAVYGANTVAFCVGLVAFTWAAPRVNVFYSLKLASWILLLLVMALFLMPQDRRPGVRVLVALGAAGAAAVLFTSTKFDASFFPADRPPARYAVRAMRSNGAHTTYVVEDPQGDALYFEAYSMSSTALPAQQYMRLMAHFPLLAHPSPTRALLICFGVGSTASAIAAHRTVEQIDVVDLNISVYETAREFRATNQGVDRDPRVTRILDDGRNFLNVTDRQYDLITSEPPPPMHEGVYRLYSAEYYQSVLAHLTERGLMTQWLSVTQMPPEAVTLAIRTFVGTFRHALLFVGYGREFILVGSPAAIDLRNIERNFYLSEGVVQDLRRLGIPTPVRLLARIIEGDAVLRQVEAGARPISDQHNDLAHLSLNPFRPAQIRYDPVRLLEELGTEGLTGGRELRALAMDLARLRDAVPDFPSSSLMTVPRGDGVAHAGADWKLVNRLNQEATQLAGQGRIPDAIDRLAASLSLVAEQRSTLETLAILRERSGRYPDAVETWRRLSELDPEDARGLLGMGRALVRLGRHEEAAEVLHRALELSPGDPAILDLLAEADSRRVRPGA